MFKKIHSNRDPRDSVLSELKKEFAVYFGKAGNCGRSLVNLYPKFIFGTMIILLLVSTGLSFTLFRKHEPSPAKVPQHTMKPVDDGFNAIWQAGSALKETIRLKREVDSITAKKILTKSDSTALVNDLDRLRLINQPFNKPKK